MSTVEKDEVISQPPRFNADSNLITGKPKINNNACVILCINGSLKNTFIDDRGDEFVWFPEMGQEGFKHVENLAAMKDTANRYVKMTLNCCGIGMDVYVCLNEPHGQLTIDQVEMTIKRIKELSL